MRESLKRICRRYGLQAASLVDRLLGRKHPKRCVLIVDDIRDVADYISLMLDQTGFETYVAKDGVEALRLARELRPDLVIMNYQMPQMDGLTALAQLRGDPIMSKQKVIVHSAFGDRPEFQRKVHELGALDCLTVPFNQERLLEAIGRAFPE